MRILLIGGGGTIGRSIHESILREHSQLSFNESSAEIIVVGRSSRPYPLDAKNEEICNIFLIILAHLMHWFVLLERQNGKS